jgi:hypothetical protein
MPFVTALGGLVSGKTETAGNVSDMVGAGELLKDLQDSGEPKKSGSLPRRIGRTKGGFGASYMLFEMALDGRCGCC